MRHHQFVPIVLLALCFSCATTPPEQAHDYSRPLAPGEVALRRAKPHEYPDFSVGFGDRGSLLEAIDESLEYYAKPSSKQHFPYEEITHERAVRSLEELRRIVESGSAGATLDEEIRSSFDVYRSVGCDGRGTVLFTAYCEPLFQGSRTPSDEYRHPLYRVPPDLVKREDGKPLGKRTPTGMVPYDTRAQIDDGESLKGKGLELVWLRDRLEAYIVHVQGSARIELPSGEEIRIGYGGKTDRPYSSLGQALVEDGKIRRDDLSLSAIKDHFRTNPDELGRYLNRNESYVFFTESEGGPYGSLNARVTPMRTIATDKSVFPRGAMAFVDTRVPKRGPAGRIVAQPFRGFVLDQDTGGAIRSAGRCDLFIGSGPDAERLAGHTRSEGLLYYLFLRDDWIDRGERVSRASD